jgi:hypothetical protein
MNTAGIATFGTSFRRAKSMRWPGATSLMTIRLRPRAPAARRRDYYTQLELVLVCDWKTVGGTALTRSSTALLLMRVLDRALGLARARALTEPERLA